MPIIQFFKKCIYLFDIQGNRIRISVLFIIIFKYLLKKLRNSMITDGLLL